MKWVMLVVAAVAIFVMLFLGMALINTGENQLSNETVESAEYQPISNSVDIIINGLMGVPLALLLVAAIAVFMLLTRVI